MSNEFEETIECAMSDDYIEHLKRKYLTKHSSDGGTQSRKTTESSDIESYSDLPANPSLTVSERRHYNHAMREIGKALKLSEKNHNTSLNIFEDSVKNCHGASNCEFMPLAGRETDGSEVPIDGKISPHMKCEKSNQNNETHGHSVIPDMSTLPSTISADWNRSSKSKSSIAISTSLEDHALYWNDDSSTLTGLSQRFLLSSNNMKPLSLIDAKAIYTELAGIYRKIQVEKQNILKQHMTEKALGVNLNSRENELAIREAFLLEKEKGLLERERAMSFAMQDIKSAKEIRAKLEGVELEVQEKYESMQRNYRAQIEKVESQVSSQLLEMKRIKSSFQVVKDQNEELRNKLLNSTEECAKLKTQNAKLRKRLENLQRKQEFQSNKTDKILRTSNKENVTEKPSSIAKPGDKSSKFISASLEALTVMFDWIIESVFKTKDLFPKALDSDIFGLTDEFIADKCLKVLPMFVDILKASSHQATLKKNQFSYLSFIYHCLRRVDDSQHSILSSTTRRLGDELYKPVSIANSAKCSGSTLILATTAAYSVVDTLDETAQMSSRVVGKPYSNLYFRSVIPEVRMLSCFIIIKTLHQVDILAHVFGQLKKDLKDDANRKSFLDFNAIHIIMPYITYKANKALLGDAVDIFMQMAMESVFLPTFLEQCSKEEWFRAFSSTIRDLAGSIDKPSFNPDVLEKICVLLQKLSKVKSNKKYFDAFSIGRSLHECYRCRDPDNTFLSLNLRSILFNLDLLKEP